MKGTRNKQAGSIWKSGSDLVKRNLPIASPLLLRHLMGLLMLLILSLPQSASGQDLDSLLAAANQNRYNYRYPMAMSLYADAVDVDSTCFQAWYQLSRLNVIEGETQTARVSKKAFIAKAIAFADSAIRLQPDSAHAHYVKGLALEFKAREAFDEEKRLTLYQEMHTSTKQALALNPGLPRAMALMGRWHYRMAQLSPSEAETAKQVFGKSGSGASLEKAAEWMEMAWQKGLETPRLAFSLGLAWYSLSDPETCKKWLKAGANLPSENPYDAPWLEKIRKMIGSMP